MASVTKNDGKNAMAEEAELTGPLDDDLPDSSAEVGRGQPPRKQPPAPPSAGGGKPAGAAGGGFFTIYKKGQGYWTRIRTVAGASLLGLVTAQFLYTHGRVAFHRS